MIRKTAQPAWHNLLGPASIGIAMMLILSGIIFVALSPANAIGTIALPQEVQPMEVRVAASSLEMIPITPTPLATPLPTSLPIEIVGNSGIRNSEKLLPTATPLPPLPGINPTRLRIPTLGINAAVEHVGLDKKNRMDVPVNIWNVAWYKLGPKPGERGNAVIDGHVDGPYTPAVFWTLNKLKVGQRIYIQDEQGQEKTFEVFDMVVYDYDKAPMDRIFGQSTDAQLNLITCTGDFDQKTANYNKRLVIYTRLVPNA